MKFGHRGTIGALMAGPIAAALALFFAVSAPADPTVLSLDASNASVGGAIHATAQLSESPGAEGEISFEVFGPGDETCTGPELTPAPAAALVSDEGQYLSGDFTPPGAGTYYWSAHYTGDSVNPSADAPCAATSTVSKATPGLTGTAGTATVGGVIHDEVDLTGGFSPTGEVTFSVYAPGDTACATVLESSTVPIQSAHASSADVTTAQAGEFRWTASYPGDDNNEAANLDCNASGQTSIVSQATPTLSGVASSVAKPGLTITDSATIAGGFSPGAHLVFHAYGPGDTACATSIYSATVAVSGNGSYSPAGFLAPKTGLYRWTVEYEGDANNAAANLDCNASGQTSIVSQATPTLSGLASSVAKPELTITDSATIAGGFSPGAHLVFHAYGPGDTACATSIYSATVAVSGNGSYSPAGFLAPKTGLYRWTVEYEGDANNAAANLACNASGQGSAVGIIAVTLTAAADGGTVGNPVTATAAIQEGAIPTGQLTFKAFPPSDLSCSGAAAFSSTVTVAGNGSYRSAAFVPSRVGSFRWTVAYSGDGNHAPAAVACGKATSSVAQAKPSIAGAVQQRVTVSTAFRDSATLQGGYAPGGTVTFRVYGPVASGCAKPLFVDTVAVSGNGTVSSDPFTAQRPGRYSFVASYSGDAANQAATEPCDSAAQATQVRKRAPRVKPRALLVGKRTISIRAQLSGGASPTGAISFRLYRPGDKHCRRRPAFSGAISVKSNGSYSLAQYLATKPGLYRLSVSYSGDQRNQQFKGDCGNAQPIRIG
jgi:hypothetical protein